MSRPAGSKNKNPYQQDQLPAELLPSEPEQKPEPVIDDTTWQTTVEESNDDRKVIEFENLGNYQLQGEETKMKEMKQVLRTIALSNMATYNERSELVAVSMSETEIYLNQLIASGWQLFYVTCYGKNEVAKTIEMLYVFTK
jgi:hypothetical protein